MREKVTTITDSDRPYPAETLIERIYREETGRKMPDSIKRILLRKPTGKRKSLTAQISTADRRDRLSDLA